MTFPDLIAPIDEHRFIDEYFDKLPLHIKAAPESNGRENILSSASFLELLEIVPQWQSGRLKMIMDSRPVPTEHYCLTREAAAGPTLYPDRALVKAMMALGASAVADGIEDVSADIRRVCASLGRRFAAKVSANVYVSHSGIQAFASHCDPHEVFALQCEGRKTWRVYGDRADLPIQATLVGDQAMIDRTKGPVIMEAVMEPGDVLYLPRGFYHDAIAQGCRSLHITFGVQPLYGLGLLDMIRDLAIERTEMRRYLGSAENTQAIAVQLSALADEVALLLKSPAMIEDIAVRQRTLTSPLTDPSSAQPYLLTRTGLPCSVLQPLEGSILAVGENRIPAGLLSDAARWVFAQAAFTPEQCRARFCHHPATEIDALLATLIRLDALEKQAIR